MLNSSFEYAICLATYNGEKYLREQIDSILCQLTCCDVLFVSDDGSTDSTRDILSSYGGKLRVVSTERAGGAVRNFERVLQAAYDSGASYFLLVDQDDVWVNGRMDLFRAALSRYDLALLDAEITNENLTKTGRSLFEVNRTGPGFIRNYIKNGYVGCCMAFRRDVLKVSLPFPPGVVWHDWYIGLIAELMFVPFHRKQTCLLYRRHGDNLSPTGDRSNNGSITKLFLRLRMLFAILVAVIRK